MTKRSPIKQKPLRNPGQSLMSGLVDLILDGCVLPMMIACAFLGMAVYAWVVELFWVQSPPLVITFAAIIAIVVAWIRILQQAKQVHNNVLGIQGEQRVGEVLDNLKPHGYRVFHDIQGDKFNIDHVVVGPTGVFVIETKTRSKPTGRKAKVKYDGRRVLVDGKAPDRDPIKQARAVSDYIRDIIHRTNLNPPIRPIVVFPGWWVAERQSRKSQVWVLNEQRLIGWLKEEPESLGPDEVTRIATLLEDASRK